MNTRLLLPAFALAFGLTVLGAQSPAPIVVQAISETAPTPVPAAPAAVNQTNEGTLKILQEMKAANEALLEKQSATLQQLDEIAKAAEQLRIYSKRG